MRKSKIVLAAAGLLLLAVLVVRLGPATLARQLAVVGWSLPVLATLGLVKALLRTWSWDQALAADGVEVSSGRLFGAAIAAQSMAYLSALGPLVGEPMKPLLLRDSAAVDASTPSTLVDTGVYWFTSALVGLTGAFAGMLLLARTPGAVAMLLLSAAVFAAALSLLLARRPVVPRARAAVCNWKGQGHQFCSLLRKAEEIENRIRSFRFRHPAAVRRMLGLGLLVQVVTAAEVLTVMNALGHHIGFLALLAVEAANRLVKILSFYVPGRVGVDEGGAAGAFLLLGMDPGAGLTLALARRMQALFWAAVGLAWLGLSGADRSAGRLVSSEQRKEFHNAGSAFITRTL